MVAGRPSTYDPAFCERVIALGLEGMSEAQIARDLGVARASLWDWAKAHEEFSAALTRARDLAQAWWEDQGVAMMRQPSANSNAAIWKKSMEARFRDDYTETRKNEHSGPDGKDLQIRWLTESDG